MKKLLLLIIAALALNLPAMAAQIDPVEVVDEAISYWEKPNAYVANFKGGSYYVYGASMSAAADLLPDRLTKNHGQLAINFYGQGQSRSYNWKTAVWGTMLLQRNLSNNDYKKILILISDRLAEADKYVNGESMPVDYYLMVIVNTLGRIQGTFSLIEYLAAATDPNINPLMAQPTNLNTPWGKFWTAIATGNNKVALSIIRSVPDERLNGLEKFRQFQMWRKKQQR